MRRPLLAAFVLVLALGCTGVAEEPGTAPEPSPPAGPELVVLGSAQDGGVPHAGCRCTRCLRARTDPERRRRGPSLAIVLPGSRPWMVDASPDFPEQLAGLLGDGVAPTDRAPLAGVLLTHAHVGHYLGLAHLGREVIGARGVPVVATPAMCAFLADNGPWDQLVALGNVELRPTEPGTPVELGAGVTATAFAVPHRDEYADTVGYRIEGPEVTVLYVPDTDRWETWDPPLESRLEGVDLALLDGTFHGLAELPGRTIETVPHPPMTVTMDRLQKRVDAGLRVVFTHLNHTNPAADPDAPEARACRERGFAIARDGDRIPLARP